MTNSVAARPDGSALCTACGFCCDGLLHDRAVLNDDEVEFATALGLGVANEKGPNFFFLPCPKLENRCCSVYLTRPRTCGSYRCRLLKGFEAGDVSLDQALAKVTSVRQLRELVIDLLPEGLSFVDMRKDMRRWRSGDGMFGTREGRKSHERLFMLASLLFMQVRRDFLE